MIPCFSCVVCEINCALLSMSYLCLIVGDVLNCNDMLVVSQILHVGYQTCSLTVLLVANCLI